MRSVKFFVLGLALAVFGCTPVRVTTLSGAAAQQLIAEGASSTTAAPGPVLTITGDNVVRVDVNGDGTKCGFPSPDSTVNMPCVSVTICAPGTSNCQTVPNLLLDTGSWGLRVFRSVIPSLPLQPEMSGTNTIAECVTYLGNTTEWGQIEYADIQLGNEPRISKIPIQVIDSGFVGATENCTTTDPATGQTIDPETSPLSAGFNGILGVGFDTQDCGEACAGSSIDPNNDPTYYSCGSASCAPVAVALTDQVTNPAAALSQDNNGVVLELPAPAQGGASSVAGALVLGIGTRLNNQPANVQAYTPDSSPEGPSYSSYAGSFQTVFTPSGQTAIPGFLDSGSSIISFPVNQGSTQFPDCSSTDTQYAGWFCPAASGSFTATNTGANGISGTAPFSIGNAIQLVQSGNIVFSDLASNAFPVDSSGNVTSTANPYFDWGLPFFLGRAVYLGFNGKTSTLGAGPYWAYH